jgi:hypothetical protein
MGHPRNPQRQNRSLRGRSSGSKFYSKINFSCPVKTTPEMPRCLLQKCTPPPSPSIFAKLLKISMLTSKYS